MKKALLLMTVILGSTLTTAYLVSGSNHESNANSDYNYSLLETKSYKALNLTSSQKTQLLKIEKEMRSQVQGFLFADDATIASQSSEISRAYKASICALLNKDQLKIYQSICKGGGREVASSH